MRAKVLPIIVVALLAAACSKEPPTVGNGPGNADGTGGRADPPSEAMHDTGGPSTNDQPGQHAEAPTNPVSESPPSEPAPPPH